MTSISERHDLAMEKIDGVRQLLVDAYHLERSCADEFPTSTPDNEPTRCVLYRSAGWIAVQAGWYDLALECAKLGLDGNIPEPIKTELEQLRKEAKRRKKMKAG